MYIRSNINKPVYDIVYMLCVCARFNQELRSMLSRVISTHAKRSHEDRRDREDPLIIVVTDNTINDICKADVKENAARDQVR